MLQEGFVFFFYRLQSYNPVYGKSHGRGYYSWRWRVYLSWEAVNYDTERNVGIRTYSLTPLTTIRYFNMSIIIAEITRWGKVRMIGKYYVRYCRNRTMVTILDIRILASRVLFIQDWRVYQDFPLSPPTQARHWEFACCRQQCYFPYILHSAPSTLGP